MSVHGFARTRFIVVLATGALLATACVQAAPTGGGGASQAPEGPVQPKVNRVILALDAPSTESNNARFVCCTWSYPLRPIYENLIGMDAATGKYIPQLASSWSVEPDGKAVRFKLRPGVPYHDPKWSAVTAKDVVHAYRHPMMFEDSHAQVAWWKRTITGEEIVNDLELVVRLNPDALFFNSIGENYGQAWVRPKAEFDAIGDIKDPAPPYTGTGPYKYLERQTGQYIRFQRVENHWRVTPDFPQLEMRWVKEASTRLAALLTGEIQITKVSDDQLPQAQSAGMTVVTNTVPGTRVMGGFIYQNWKADRGLYLIGDSPLADSRVRQALNKAIDRQALTKAFVPRGQLMYANHVPAGQPGYDPSWEKRFAELYGYDVEKAKALLASAGYGPAKPAKISIILGAIPPISNADDVAEAIAAQWKAVGVQVALLNMDAGAKSAARAADKFDNHFSLTGTSTDPGQGILVYNSLYGSTATRGPMTAEVITSIRQQQAELDPDKQGPLLQKILDWGYTNFWDVPLWWVPVEAVVNPKIVAGWVFPGTINGTYTHVENIKAAR